MLELINNLHKRFKALETGKKLSIKKCLKIEWIGTKSKDNKTDWTYAQIDKELDY